MILNFSSFVYGSPECRNFVLQHSQLSGEHPRLESFGLLTESKKMFMCEIFSFILVASNLMIVNFREMLSLLLFAPNL